jgi:general stress protein YciG
MKCPHCGKKINAAALMGAKGGKASGASKARDPEKMRAAALLRWEKKRAHDVTSK